MIAGHEISARDDVGVGSFLAFGVIGTRRREVEPVAVAGQHLGGVVGIGIRQHHRKVLDTIVDLDPQCIAATMLGCGLAENHVTPQLHPESRVVDRGAVLLDGNEPDFLKGTYQGIDRVRSDLVVVPCVVEPHQPKQGDVVKVGRLKEHAWLLP